MKKRNQFTRRTRRHTLGQTTFSNVFDLFGKEGEALALVEHSITTPTVIALGVMGTALIVLNKVVNKFIT